MEKNQLILVGLVLAVIIMTPIVSNMTYFFAQILIG